MTSFNRCAATHRDRTCLRKLGTPSWCKDMIFRRCLQQMLPTPHSLLYRPLHLASAMSRVTSSCRHGLNAYSRLSMWIPLRCIIYSCIVLAPED